MRPNEANGAYLDGELGGAEREAFEARLEVDAGLREELEAYRELDAELRAHLVPGAEDRRVADAVVRHFEGTGRPATRSLSLLWAVAAGFLLGALIFAGPEWRAGEVAGPAIQLASVGPLRGLVESSADPDSGFLPVRSGDSIPAGARLRTGVGAKCTLQLADGSLLHCNEDTSIEIEAARRVALRSGQVFAVVKPAESRFLLEAGGLELEALGTELDLVHRLRPVATGSEALTILTVLEGRVRMGEQVVEQREVCFARDGKVEAPTPAQELDLLTGWVNELLALDRSTRPELERRLQALLAQLGRTKLEFLLESEIRSLGDHCVLPLSSYLRESRGDPESYQRRRAAAILSDLATLESLPELVDLLGDPDARVRVAVAGALARLTGTNHGFDATYWSGADGSAGQAAWRQRLEQQGTPVR